MYWHLLFIIYYCHWNCKRPVEPGWLDFHQQVGDWWMFRDFWRIFRDCGGFLIDFERFWGICWIEFWMVQWRTNKERVGNEEEMIIFWGQEMKLRGKCRRCLHLNFSRSGTSDRPPCLLAGRFIYLIYYSTATAWIFSRICWKLAVRCHWFIEWQ